MRQILSFIKFNFLTNFVFFTAQYFLISLRCVSFGYFYKYKIHFSCLQTFRSINKKVFEKVGLYINRNVSDRKKDRIGVILPTDSHPRKTYIYIVSL